MGAIVKLGAAVVVGAAVLPAVLHPGHHHGHGALAHLLSDVGSIPSGGGYTRTSWARTFLHSAGLPATRCNVSAITAWETREGGHWANSAHYNPLNTTQREPGSYSMNSVGVQAYTSWHEGLAASVTTLGNGRYPGIIAALRAGNNAQRVGDAVGASPWGTPRFGAAC